MWASTRLTNWRAISVVSARLVVEGGHHREDGGPGVGCDLHVAQVDAVEGGLAHAEDEAAVLLKADVGGALDQVGGHSVN